jgi:hypothetical protein
MKPDFSTILETCIEKVRQGHSLDECLLLYPQHAEALRPLLLAVQQAQYAASIQPNPEAVQSGRERMLAAARQQVKPERIQRRGIQPVLRFALYLVMVLALAGFLTINASARSLPGDSLYGVKRGWEQVRLSLADTNRSRDQLEAHFNRERFAELDRMVAQRRPGILTLEGVVEKISPTEWVVDGLQVTVTPQTLLDGVPFVGAQLTIQVQVQADGSLLVLEAHPGSSGVAEPSDDEESIQTPEPVTGQEPTETVEPGGGEEPPETEEPTETEEPGGEQDPPETEEPSGEQDPPEESPNTQESSSEQGSLVVYF